MKLVIYSAILASLFTSCASIRTEDYFRLEENHTERFNGVFVKPSNFTYSALDNSFGRHPGKDSVSENYIIAYRTVNIDGYKAFYALETSNLGQPNPPVGPHHFLSSALIFKDGEVLMAPVFHLKDVKELRFSDFRYKIPATVKRKDTITIQDGNKKMLLCQFKKENIIIGQREFKGCLKVELVVIWPGSTSRGYVWLSKEYGIVKWIRTTGRTETKDLKGSNGYR